jgi:hypothetical protein
MPEKKVFNIFTEDDFSFPLSEDGSMEAYSESNVHQINSTAREIFTAQKEKQLNAFFDNWMNLLLQSGGTMDHVGTVYEVSLQVLDFVKAKKKEAVDVHVNDFRPWAVTLIEVLNKVLAKH